MRHIKTPELLWPALRQYRHNTDNSPNINHPENGFVTGFDYDETVVVVKRLEQQLAELREVTRELANDVEAYADVDRHGRFAYPHIMAKWESDMEPVNRARALLQERSDE